MKKFMILILTILGLGLSCLLGAYISNEVNINDYESGRYSQNVLAFLGFTEPYIRYYNEGNIYYKQQNYEKALKSYDKALEKNPPHKKSTKSECQIRINKALTIIAIINRDYEEKIEEETLEAAEIEEILKLLEQAKDVLTEHECAINETEGHNDDAVTLYKEICEFEEKIKNQSKEESKDNKDNKDNKYNNEDDKKDDSNVNDKLEELKQNQHDNTVERNRNIQQDEEIGNFDFYTGPTW